MNNTDRIARLAQKLHWVTAFFLFALPVALFLGLISTGLDKDLFLDSIEYVNIQSEISYLQIWLCIGLEGLILIAIIYTLEQMRRLFSQFAKRHIFDFVTADIISKVGIGLLVIVAMAVSIHTVQVLVLTWTNPPGQTALSLEIDDSDIGFLLSAGLLMIIGWAMRDAATLAAENQEFI